MSIFNTLPPLFHSIDIEKIAFDYFGIDVKAVELNSERDQNFYLSDISGQEYVMKVFNAAEKPPIVDMQNQAMSHVAKMEPTIRVSSIVKTLGGSDVLEYAHGGTLHLVRVLRYIPGRQLKDVDHNVVSLTDLGAFLGKLDHSLIKFHHPAAKREFPWDIRNINFIEIHYSQLWNERNRSLLDHFLNQYKKNILPNEAQLRKAVIHNDGNDHNVLVNESGDTIGIIDFGDMVYTFIVCEPAVCIAYMVLGKNDPFNVAAQLLKGYHQAFSLSLDEVMAVIYLVCVRSCITVTMAAYRRRLFPNNAYISVSDTQAWEFLKYMHKQDLNDWAEKLLQYVNP
ncbi:uncharacterized protein METZ01_LOCUS92367 [marine metagenome]|jgi:Ser/Thr protein kinase RdoA (MazF antagonist)|uniref:Hydroxylysine kinase n=1 Tax=marine metagenome TaxID=408172 RepID=A0A381VJ63_9ZZZZ|tara:strand:- start:211 stop:1227 length:1017 start_codon:yes stop_codon:yes gene_type:complete